MPSQYLRFEFDPRKAAFNLLKHGASFDEAIATFYDTNAKNWEASGHSETGDERFLNLGRTTSLCLLLVVHNEEDGVIRSSARGPRLRPNETFMKKPESSKTSPAASSTAVRGKYTNLLKRGSNVVILDPALMLYFPDSESVNRALHAFLAIGESVHSATPSRRRARPAASRADAAFDPRKGSQGHALAAGD